MPLTTQIRRYWHQRTPFLFYYVSSSDGTAVIWKIDDATDGDTNTDGTSTPIVGILEHVGVENSPIDATTVEWSVRKTCRFSHD